MVQTKVLDRVRDFRFLCIMIDESTNISVIGHLVVFLLVLLRRDFIFVYLLDYCILKKGKKFMYNI